MEIVRPGDRDYAQDRKISNARFDYDPSLIVYCSTEQDVVDALRMARAGKYPIRVRSGGHQHEGMCSGDRVLMVDVSRMNKIEFDDNRYDMVRIGPGAKLGDIYTAVLSRGLLFPGGACEDVRVGGLAQGGGWGLFARALGLTCDWLDRFRMVTHFMNGPIEDFHAIDVSGRSDDPNKDLHWAVCGGGGGNFGVATEFEFRLVPFKFEPGKVKAVTQFTATWSDRRLMRPVLDEWLARFPGDEDYRLTSFCRLIAPGTESMDKPSLVFGNFVGAQGELTEVLKRLMPNTYATAQIAYKQVAVWPPAPSLGPSIFTHPQYQLGAPGAPQDLSTTCSGAFFRHKVSSTYPGASFGANAVDAIVSHINATSLADARRYISFHSLGGVVQDGPRNEWSCFAYRTKPFLMQYQAWWAKTELDGVCLDWIKNFRNGMRPYTEGSFINFPDRDIVNTTDRKTLMRPYYGNNLDKLVNIKQVYDPMNVFDFPMGIPPT